MFNRLFIIILGVRGVNNYKDYMTVVYKLKD